MGTVKNFEDLQAWQKARGLAGYDPEFTRFLRMARRSAGKVQSELYLALDANYISDEELKKALAVETKKLINGFIKYLRNSD
jgi:four helix bundle protein